MSPVLLFAVIALLGCTEAPDPGSQQVGVAEAERAVRAMIEEYYRDFSARDWEAYAGHFWPGASLATLWQESGEAGRSVFMSTVPEFIARAPEGPDSKPIFEERLVSAEIRVSGSLGQVWAHYEAEFGDPGDLMHWTGVDAFTLLRHGGRWRITSLAFVGS